MLGLVGLKKIQNCRVRSHQARVKLAKCQKKEISNLILKVFQILTIPRKGKMKT